jgi:tetratricopeptide (TPR) repeat protein
MRRKLGESLTSIQKFDTPIEEATTPSLEALKAYSMGRRLAYLKGDLVALPYQQQAVELDPKFARAYRALAIYNNNLGRMARARENAKKAFELRERVSVREKYTIESTYYFLVTGELDKCEQAYELYKHTYPQDYLPRVGLGDNDMRLGQWEKAFEETQESLRLEANDAIAVRGMDATGPKSLGGGQDNGRAGDGAQDGYPFLAAGALPSGILARRRSEHASAVGLGCGPIGRRRLAAFCAI